MHVFTARVRSTREGNVLTPVCVSVHTCRGGYPISGPGRGGTRSTPPPPQNTRIASTCYGYPDGRMPLAFTQEDFLVLHIFSKMVYSFRSRICQAWKGKRGQPKKRGGGWDVNLIFCPIFRKSYTKLKLSYWRACTPGTPPCHWFTPYVYDVISFVTFYSSSWAPKLTCSIILCLAGESSGRVARP